ncbi:MAG: hypothetical protein VX335_00905 [Pseudomonadota bacterium]|nr:hypothetical protein [Pseudomonadota bacterium]
MTNNKNKLIKKIKKTGPAHLISLTCIVLGAFFPAPMATAFLIFLVGSLFYESKQGKKEAKNFTHDLGTQNYSREIEETTTDELIDIFCNIKDRHLAIMSIGTGMICGSFLGSILACIFIEFSWPTVIVATLLILTAIAIRVCVRSMNQEVPELSKTNTFVPAKNTGINNSHNKSSMKQKSGILSFFMKENGSESESAEKDNKLFTL